MAGSSVSSMSIGGGSNAVKLDVVSGSKGEGGAGKGNSLSKIAKFKPSQLKDFSSNISKTTSERKEASLSRNAEQALVKKKVQSIRSQNPFANKGLAESRTGAKINVST